MDDWMYEDVPHLDPVRLFRLGDAVPLWTKHFANWKSFTWRVKEAKCTQDWTALWSAHGWYTDDDLTRAWGEVRCGEG